MGLAETLEPKHFVTATKPTLSLVIFDRDGTLIEDTGYPIDPNNIIWKRGALSALAWLKAGGIAAAVATNQSGVARGFFTLGQVHAFHAAMDITVQAEAGRIDAYAICPHLVDGSVAEYAVECDCRKPKSGLVSQLMAKFRVSPESVVMIGDRETDVLAGQAVGVESFRYDGGDLFIFTRRVISGHFASRPANSAQVTSKASRSS